MIPPPPGPLALLQFELDIIDFGGSIVLELRPPIFNATRLTVTYTGFISSPSQPAVSLALGHLILSVCGGTARWHNRLHMEPLNFE